MMEGESIYNTRHKQGRIKGLRLPFGSLVHFMPQLDVKRDAFESETMWGIFLGYYVLPGGFWKGDYLVADYAASMSGVKVHWIKEVIPNLTRTFEFLIAETRRESELHDMNFDMAEVAADECEDEDGELELNVNTDYPSEAFTRDRHRRSHLGSTPTAA